MEDSVFVLAKQGDEHSTDLLVEQYYRLAYSTAYDWIRKGVISKEDGISEANLALMKCIRGTFDPSKGDFTSYLVKAVDNQVRMYLRKERKDRMIDYIDNVVTLEDGVTDIFEIIADDTHCVADIVEDSLLVEEILEVLEEDATIKPVEALCFILRAEGMTCDEIADTLDMSQSYASRLSNTAVLKVRKRMELSGGL